MFEDGKGNEAGKVDVVHKLCSGILDFSWGPVGSCTRNSYIGKGCDKIYFRKTTHYEKRDAWIMLTCGWRCTFK